MGGDTRPARPTFWERLPLLARRYVPIITWLPRYDRTWLQPDLIGSITSWGVMVPVALAYAALAGVPPEVGLTTAFAALAAYAILGTSRHLKVTASSTMAIMSASVVAGLAAGDPGRYLALSSALALMVGAILIAAGVARLGFIADFLSKSVITGFIFGLAITIIIGQLPKILGVPGGGDTTLGQLATVIGQVPDTNPWTLAVGGSALALILFLRLVSRRIPGPLVALVLGILAVGAFDLTVHGVTVVGEVATGLPHVGIPRISPLDLPYLAAGAAGIVFLAVGESLGAARAFATRHRYEIDPDQELFGLGAANVSAGLFGGFTVDASLSQSATAESAGVKSQLSSLVTAALILATAVFLAPIFANLPNAVLGAIVVAAVLSLMDVGELRRYWRSRRPDFVLAVTALVGVVTTTVLVGLVIAVLLSVVMLLYRASRPYIAVLGEVHGQKGTYADVERHPGADAVPGLLMLRIDAPLYFFNANVARSTILSAVDGADPKPAAVVLDVGATADLDITTSDMVRQLAGDLRDRSVDLLLAQVKGSVRDRMRMSDLMDVVGEDHIWLSVGAAVAAFGSPAPAPRRGALPARGGLELGGPREHRPPAPGELEQDPGERDRHEPEVEPVEEDAGGDRRGPLLPGDRGEPGDEQELRDAGTPGGERDDRDDEDEGVDAEDHARVEDVRGHPAHPERDREDEHPRELREDRDAERGGAALPDDEAELVAETVDRAVDVGRALPAQAPHEPPDHPLPGPPEPVGDPLRADDRDDEPDRDDEDDRADDRDRPRPAGVR